MPTSVRLDPETLATLRRLARARQTTQSDIIREAVAAYGVADDKAPSLFERIQHVVGSGPGGPGDRSVDTGRKFTALLRERKRDR